jgi:ABC-type multidrug transport system ATPase subunit
LFSLSQNLCVYIDQIDRLHPYLTVQETLEFAWQCRSGGTHAKFHHDIEDPAVKKKIQELDENLFTVKAVMDVLGLTRVKDTFVGDQLTVRGVSGGEKKRVTVGEMFCVGTPVMCCDEISTGLDGECGIAKPLQLFHQENIPLVSRCSR